MQMEFKFGLPIHQFSAEAASLFALILFLYYLFRLKQKADTNGKVVPQPSSSWPLIGHLHLLEGLPHIALGKLADKYGPIFVIRLGVQRALVVSTAEMAKECLGGTNDKVFLNRPQTIFVEHMAYNGAMLGFSQYGQYWREIRKFTTIELLSNHRVEMLKNVRVSEIRSAMKSISTARSETTDMKQWFTDVSMNTIVRIISGRSMKECYQGEEYSWCLKAFWDFFELAGVFVPADALPFLRWFDIRGYEKKMKKVAKEIDLIVERWLDERKNRRSSKEAQGKLDFMDVMLGIFETGQETDSKFETDTIIKATCTKRKTDNAKRKPPQPSGSWPIIGHLPLLRRGLPHIIMGNLADKYGPIFMKKLGVHQALVVNSSETAKECLHTNDRVFASRPCSTAAEHLGYNSLLLGYSPYGPYWREMRKIVMSELLSNNRLEMLERERTSEVRSVIKAIYESYLIKRKLSPGNDSSFIVDMKQCFNDISSNTSVKLIAGKSLNEFYPGEEEHYKCTKALRDFFDLGGIFVPSDALPFLGWLDIGGYQKAMKKVAKEINHVAQGWLDEHKGRRLSENHGKEKQDFIDVMLGIMETRKNDPALLEADKIIKAISMAMILGATDTTSATLTWALSLLLNNRESLKKAQTEIDNQVGKGRLVEESDLKKLIYLQAVLKETMRLYPAVPLTQREAITDCTVSGYQILAGTQLFINISKIQRDPKLWTDPLEFRPERFLTTHTECDVRGQNFELIPFGSGRRSCPGITYALLSMQFTLANLLHSFDVSTLADEAVDMTEGFGITNLKVTPLEVILNPRLPDHHFKLY